MNVGKKKNCRMESVFKMNVMTVFILITSSYPLRRGCDGGGRERDLGKRRRRGERANICINVGIIIFYCANFAFQSFRVISVCICIFKNVLLTTLNSKVFGFCSALSRLYCSWFYATMLRYAIASDRQKCSFLIISCPNLSRKTVRVLIHILL